MNRVDGSAGTFVAITSAASAMESGSVFASITTCASWLSSCVNFESDCSAGSGVGGVTFGRDGVALSADGFCCASAANAAGRKARRMLESFIALASGRGSWKIRFGDTVTVAWTSSIRYLPRRPLSCKAATGKAAGVEAVWSR